jgi:hypothetical protein
LQGTTVDQAVFAIQLSILNRMMFLAGFAELGSGTFPITAFGRSRPAADASREVVERWLLDGLM